MDNIYKFILFLLFFNMACFFVASTAFFPNTFYGDIVVSDTYDITDPDNLPTPEEMFENFITNTATGEVASFAGNQLTFGYVMGGLILVGLGASFLTKSTTPIAFMLIGLLFTTMWANSKTVLDSLTSNMGGSIQYLLLMFGVGVLILFVITIIDMASGQRSRT